MVASEQKRSRGEHGRSGVCSACICRWDAIGGYYTCYAVEATPGLRSVLLLSLGVLLAAKAESSQGHNRSRQQQRAPNSSSIPIQQRHFYPDNSKLARYRGNE